MKRFMLPLILTFVIGLAYAILYYAGTFLGGLYTTLTSETIMLSIMGLNGLLLIIGLILFYLDFTAEKRDAARRAKELMEQHKREQEEIVAKKKQEQEFEGWMTEAQETAKTKAAPKAAEMTQEQKERYDAFTKEHTRLKEMMNNAKYKYSKRQIDEATFRELMREYSRQIIELEATYKMSKKQTEEI